MGDIGVRSLATLCAAGLRGRLCSGFGLSQPRSGFLQGFRIRATHFPSSHVFDTAVAVLVQVQQVDPVLGAIFAIVLLSFFFFETIPASVFPKRFVAPRN